MSCGYDNRGRPAPARSGIRTCLHAVTSSRCLTSSGVPRRTPQRLVEPTTQSPRTTAPVNHYARIVKSYYLQHLPSRAAAMSEQDFAEMGETIAAQIVELTARLEGPDSPSETDLEKVGRLNRARMQATETVLHDWLTETEPGTDPDEETDTELAALWETVHRLQDDETE